MSTVSIKITGAADFRKNAMAALKSIEAQTELTLDKVADATFSDMQANTPVLTGELRDSEFIEKERLTRIIGATAGHAMFVHQGTYKMASRPFAFNAWEHNRQSLVRDLKAMKV